MAASSLCSIRKCEHDPVFIVDCKAYENDVPRVNLSKQGFCFWHYVSLKSSKLKVRDFWTYIRPRGKDYSDLTVEITR